jgi:hypothetical protein
MMAIKKEYLSIGGLLLAIAVAVIIISGCCQGIPTGGPGSSVNNPYLLGSGWQGPGYYQISSPMIPVGGSPPTPVLYTTYAAWYDSPAHYMIL